MSYFIIEVSEQEIRREKDKARELRKSQWWKNRVGRGICHWCGGKFPLDDLTMDHIVPIVRGGKSSRGNLVPACKECNNKKKYMLPIEWEEYLKTVTGDRGPDPTGPEGNG
ncbi:MAG: HNH endonuclease [Geobacter sp.]|nr:HNH endonuclease [Geobacter sp.]